MFEISDEKYEELRLILEKQNERTYTVEEAREVGDQLIDFSILLGELNDKNKARNDNNTKDQVKWSSCSW